MNKFQLVALSLAVPTLVCLQACSTGGLPQNPGTQCASDYQPNNYPIDAVNTHKVQTKGDGTIDLPPGVYTYRRADLYFVEDQYAPLQNYRVHVADVLTKDGVTFGGAVMCQRNARVGLGTLNLNVSAMGLSSLGVDATGKPVPFPSVKSYGFQILPEGPLQLNMIPVPNQKPTDPGAFYTDPSVIAFIHPENPAIIDIRSQGRAKDQAGNEIGDWFLAVTFERTDLPKP